MSSVVDAAHHCTQRQKRWKLYYNVKSKVSSQLKINNFCTLFVSNFWESSKRWLTYLLQRFLLHMFLLLFFLIFLLLFFFLLFCTAGAFCRLCISFYKSARTATTHDDHRSCTDQRQLAVVIFVSILFWIYFLHIFNTYNRPL